MFLALSEQVSQHLSSHSPWFASHVTIALLIAGAFGDAVGSILRLPAEVLCKRLQTNSAVCWNEALRGTSKESWVALWNTILVYNLQFNPKNPTAL